MILQQFSLQIGLCWLVFCGGLSAQTVKKPNIVIFMSDDQDVMLGSMDVMHHTQEQIVRKGATFSNAFTTSPICCPSRSSFLTGLYSHNHNVLTNNQNCSSPQWQREHETRTFATYLNKDGYATGYFGKYLNEYNGTYIPPGWQYWMGLIKNTKYYNYTLRHNEEREQHRDDYEKDYFTDLIVNRSMKYFRRMKQEDSNRPILTMLSFPAPHGTEDAAPQYQHLYQNVTSHINPSFDFGPNDDKHWIISRLRDPMDATQHRFSTLLQQKRLQTLRSVDDGVEKFVRMLHDIGEIDNTYLLYTSDHGFHIGQFRIAKGKSMPYDFDIRVPFYLRGPDITKNSNINQIVLNIDIAPTILGIARIPIPEWMDGRNFMPLLQSRSDQRLDYPWRDTFLVEKGVIPHTKIHLTRPKLPSKQEKVNQACQRPQFQNPCAERQQWTCVLENGNLKMRKCKKMNGNSSNGSKKKKKCLCSRKNASKKVSTKCRKRIDNFKRETASQVHPRGYSKKRDLQRSRKFRRGTRRHRRGRADPQLGFMTGSFPSSSPLCSLLPRGSYNINCVEGSAEMTPSQTQAYISQLQMNIRILKLYGVCRSLRKEKKCKCLKQKKQKRRFSSKHPMKLITKEINDEHSRRVEKFQALKSEQQTQRQLIKEKKARRNQSGKRCSGSGVNCFLLNHNRWVTPPTWDGEDRCYCTASNNNTYWCIRTINDTSDLLYCEFVTGFVEYYDMRSDPFQLYNTYIEQTSTFHVALNSELAQLRMCKGAKSCHVSRGDQSAVELSNSSFYQNTSSNLLDPLFDGPGEEQTTISSASHPLNDTSLQPLLSKKKKPRRPQCNKQLKRTNHRRWKELCTQRKRSKLRHHRKPLLNRRY